MKNRIFAIVVSLMSAMSASAGIVAYQLTAKNTSQDGIQGKIVYAQACSTNSTSSAVLSSVTKISVNGVVMPYTNELVSVGLTNGVGFNEPTNGIYTASKQSLIVSGNAFPGGSMIIWIDDGK